MRGSQLYETFSRHDTRALSPASKLQTACVEFLLCALLEFDRLDKARRAVRRCECDDFELRIDFGDLFEPLVA